MLRRFNFNPMSLVKRTAITMVGVFAYSFVNKYVENKWYRYALFAALLALNIPAPAALEIVNQLFNTEQ